MTSAPFIPEVKGDSVKSISKRSDLSLSSGDQEETLPALSS